MSLIILAVPHIQQRTEGECLAACAAMLLAHFKIPVTYEQLLKALGVNWFGAPASNIQRLEQLGLSVSYEAGDLTSLQNQLKQGCPCIAFVQTGELPYWTADVAHAVVVVGLDEENVYLNDPEFATAPRQVARGDFDLAWLARDEYYAVIRPA